MTSLFSALQTKDALTNNGAITNSTTQNFVLDLFFIAGAARNVVDEALYVMLQKAWNENKLQTLKLIFWAGDVREGAGERRFFRVALKWLENNYKEILEKVITQVPEYNRWDSLFHLKSEIVIDYAAYKLGLDTKGEKDVLVSILLGKWMPRVYNKQFKDFRIAFQKKYKLNDAKYRKLIVAASKTVEQQMSKKEWDKIVYEHVPSVASNKYRTAFFKHDEQRYKEYIESVKKGEKKMNASAIFPHDIYKTIKTSDCSSPTMRDSIIVQWNSLPNYLEGSNEKILPICDVSGSMSGLPLDISVALGIYFSERNNSIFKDGFITFSNDPKLQILKGNLIERVNQLEKAQWDVSTDFRKVFTVMLNKAKENNVKQEDMPTTLLCISDMEFNSAGGNRTNFEAIKQDYKEAGYEFPKLVFWNVNGRPGNCPITKDDKAILVSGASPSVIKSVLSGGIDPVRIMENILNSKRYSIFNDIVKEFI